VCEQSRAADAAKEKAEKEALEAYNSATKVAQDEYDAAINETKVKYVYVRSRSSRYDKDDRLTRSRYLHRGISIMAGIPEARSIMTTSPTMRDTTESTPLTQIALNSLGERSWEVDDIWSIGFCSVGGEILSVGQILVLCSMRRNWGSDMLKETPGLPWIDVGQAALFKYVFLPLRISVGTFWTKELYARW
jgi:hypothetical protein